MDSIKEEGQPGWERKLVESLALEALKEQRRRRRWGVFFKLIGVVYFGVFLLLALGGPHMGERLDVGPHTALVDLRGVIAADSEASADRINQSLRTAFESELSKGVILRINSPGGSPVQAGLIVDEIKRLRAKYPNKPLYAVVEEICASGGYYVAVAADKIYVDKASLIGSIGVLMDGFGFVDAMNKLGVERRLLTAGEHKGFLDPFSPQRGFEKEFATQMLQSIHQQFIKVVREGRGDRLKEDPLTFSGLVWNGEDSLKNGIADDLGSIRLVANEVIKAETILDYTEQESFAERVAKRVGVTFGKSISSGFLSGVYETRMR